MKQFVLTNSQDSKDIPVIIYEAVKENDLRKNYVFFHGLATDKDEYLDFYKNLGVALSERGHNVVCFDARCHGENRQPPNQFTISNLVSDGIEVIKWLQSNESVDQVYLFGTSFGAIPAIIISSLIPEYVTKLVLLAPVIDLEKIYLRPESPERIEKFSNLVANVIYLGTPLKLSDTVYFTRNMVTELATTPLTNILCSLRMQVDVLHGTSDTIIPYSLSKSICDHAGNLLLHTFENMDHGFMDYDDEEGTSKKSEENFLKILSILE